MPKGTDRGQKVKNTKRTKKWRAKMREQQINYREGEREKKGS